MPGTALRVGVTFLCVALCWVFFRAATFGAAATLLSRLVVPHGGLPAPLPVSGFWYTAAFAAVCHAAARRGDWLWVAERLPGPALGASYAAAMTLVLVLAPPSGMTFIYFQF